MQSPFRRFTSVLPPYHHHLPGTALERRIVTRDLLGIDVHGVIIGVPTGATLSVISDIGPHGFVGVICEGDGKHVLVHAADLLDRAKLCDTRDESEQGFDS